MFAANRLANDNDQMALTVRDDRGDVVLTGALSREGDNLELRLVAPSSGRSLEQLRRTQIPRR
jgi:hypothetical protein